MKLKIFFANFQTLGPLGCQGWVVIPQNVKKSQKHCTLLTMHNLSVENDLMTASTVHISAAENGSGFAGQQPLLEQTVQPNPCKHPTQTNHGPTPFSSC